MRQHGCGCTNQQIFGTPPFAPAVFEASSTMCNRCFETQSSPGCTCTRRSKTLTHSLPTQVFQIQNSNCYSYIRYLKWKSIQIVCCFQNCMILFFLLIQNLFCFSFCLRKEVNKKPKLETPPSLDPKSNLCKDSKYLIPFQDRQF